MKDTFRKKVRELLLSNASARQIALGLSVGVFLSFSPLYGLQMPMCLLVVLIFKGLNKVAVFLGVQLSWFYPPMLYLDYLAGRYIMPGACPVLDFDFFKRGTVRAGIMVKELAAALVTADFSGINRADFTRLWELIIGLFPVLFIGSLVVGGAAASVTYIIAVNLIGRYKLVPPGGTN